MKYIGIMDHLGNEKADYAHSVASRLSDDWTLKNTLTTGKWEAFQSGKITREQAEGIAVSRIYKKSAEEVAKKEAWLESIADADGITEINLYMHRTPSGTVMAECTVYDMDGNPEVFSGKASGWGYDKESAAVADALNKCNSVRKLMCDVKEQAIADGINGQKVSSGVESNREYLCYGAGYGAIPYLEGGVGISSTLDVLAHCGLKVIDSWHGVKSVEWGYTLRAEKEC